MRPKQFDPNYCYQCGMYREEGHVCRPVAVIPRAPGEARVPGWRSRGLPANMKFAVVSTPKLDAARIALAVARAAHDASPGDEGLRQAWIAADLAHHSAFHAAQGKWTWVDGKAVWKSLEDDGIAPPASAVTAMEMAARGDEAMKASAAAVAAVSGSSVYSSPAYLNSWARWVATADDPVDPFPPYRSAAARAKPAVPIVAVVPEPTLSEPASAVAPESASASASAIVPEPASAELASAVVPSAVPESAVSVIKPLMIRITRLARRVATVVVR